MVLYITIVTTPNCDWDTHSKHKGFKFFALRDIEPGEEILYILWW